MPIASEYSDIRRKKAERDPLQDSLMRPWREASCTADGWCADDVGGRAAGYNETREALGKLYTSRVFAAPVHGAKLRFALAPAWTVIIRAVIGLISMLLLD